MTQKYRHYKDKSKVYEVICTAIHSETLDEMVVYKALYDSKEFGKNAIWVRPKKMFEETLIIDGKTVKRFELIK